MGQGMNAVATVENKQAVTEANCDELKIAQNWLLEGRKVALATVLSTWGSAPRRSGSHLVVDSDGNFHGSVSGGCVEGEVITTAVDVISEGVPKILEFGVATETAWRVGLACGGQIKIYVQPINEDVLKQINEHRRLRLAAATITELKTGVQHLLSPNEALKHPKADIITKGLRSGNPVLFEENDGEYFLNVYLPQPRLIIIGAVHIAQALTPMAHIAGYPIEIIDPRKAFASKERFAQADIYDEWPEDVFKDHPLDRYCAVAAITHDPKIDDVAIKLALEANCFYVGALGGRKSNEKRLERLLAQGVSQSDLARIHAPIGLNIGSANPAEIAVSILAQVIASNRLQDKELQ